MIEQLALNLTAVSVGFVSAVYCGIGNALNASDKILLQSTLFWDFNAPVAHVLTSQRAQYLVGALLLIAAFLLQVVSALASSTTPAALPQSLDTWSYLVFFVLLPTGLFAVFLRFYIKSHFKKSYTKMKLGS